MSWASPAADLAPMFIMDIASKASSQGPAVASMSRCQPGSSSRSASHDQEGWCATPYATHDEQVAHGPPGVVPKGTWKLRRLRQHSGEVRQLHRQLDHPVSANADRQQVRHAGQGELTVQFQLEFSGIPSGPRRCQFHHPRRRHCRYWDDSFRQASCPRMYGTHAPNRAASWSRVSPARRRCCRRMLPTPFSNTHSGGLGPGKPARSK